MWRPFVLFFQLFCASDCVSCRFSQIILPALTETLFFSSIDSFFLLFLFLLRTNLRSNLNAFHKNLESTNLLNLRTSCLCNYCQS